ncbi:MAG: catalase [Mycobacterium sp.]|nr:catalase [Mycobacterium sp.]
MENYLRARGRAGSPASVVPGTGLSPDRLLLGRSFAYADAHRHRVGVNHDQLPVNAPKAEVRSYAKDGAMRYHNHCDPVYVPNSVGGPHANPARAAEVRWAADGQMVRAAQTLRRDDDDWGQAGTLVREVMDDAQRERLVHNVVLHVCDGVKEPVLSRVFEYWRIIDPDIGKEDRRKRARETKP